MRAALGRTFEAARVILEAHGATVEKFIGDAVMAVFGVPNAHDDDADRAVRAAFALRDRVAELAREGVPLELRIGVNSGEAVAGTGQGAQFLVTGPVVNAGARLQQAAQPGEILVGALTRRTSEGGASYGEAREIDAKGIGRITAWPAVALASAVPEQHRGLPGFHAPLIGRDRELRLLREAFERLAAGDTPSLVTVFGPAGAGKTRLVSEFLDSIGRDRVRVGRCLPYGEGITFYPLQLILRSDAAIELTDDRATALAKLRDASAKAVGPDEAGVVTARLAVIAGVTPADEALPGVAPEDLAEELRWGFRRYAERRSATGPLALVFEDVHWAESALLDLIEHLAEFGRGPFLILCVARPDFRELRPTFGSSAPNAVAITLAPLAPDDTRRLIAELLAIDDLSESVRTEVVTRAEGNPLFVEEFLRTLIETGRVDRRGGRWIAAADLGPLEVPPTLVGLISSRLDRVSPDVKRILQRASLVGRLFSTSALEAIGGARVSPALLREAVRRDLLLEADERAPGEGRVHRFRHVLIREVAYSTVPKSERTRMHDRYSRWLEVTFGERKDEFGEIIAYHAEQAFLYARELTAADASELGARALALLLPVADRARERGDERAALKLYERAGTVADAIGADPRLTVRANGWAAVLGLLAHGGSPERDSKLDLMIAEADRLGEHRVLFDMTLHKARALFNVEGVDARPLAARLPEIARATGDPDLVVRAFVDVGLHAYWLMDLPGERAATERAVEEGRRTGAPSRLVALNRLVVHIARRQGRFSEAAAYERERELAIPAERSKLQQAQDQMARTNWLFLSGDFAGAARAGERGLAFARETGMPRPLGFALWFLGGALLELDEAERARAALEEGAAVVRGLGSRGQIPELSARAALACVQTGDRAAAREHLAAAKAALLAEDLDSFRVTATAEAELTAAEGDRASAERVLRDTIARLEGGTGFGMDLALTQMAYGALLVDWGRADDARAVLAQAREFFRDPVAEGWRRRIDAILARAPVRSV